MTLRFLATCMLAFVSISAHAQLYGLDASGFLFTIDTTSGAGTVVGQIVPGPNGCSEEDEMRGGGDGYNSLTYDSTADRAWAQERNGCFAMQEFDLSSASAIDDPVDNGASFHATEFIDGVLYAVGFAGDLGAPTLVTLDPTTGTPNTIGPINIMQGVATGLAYQRGTATLFAINGGGEGNDLRGEGVDESTLYTLDMATGAATAVGATGMVAGSLSFGPDGNLYAGGVADNRGELWRINPSTGQGTLVGPTGFGTGPRNGLAGLTLVGDVAGAPSVLPIPVASPIAQVLFTLLLAGAAMIWVRRSLP